MGSGSYGVVQALALPKKELGKQRVWANAGDELGLIRDALGLIRSGAVMMSTNTKLKQQVIEILEMIRPAVQGDGGDIELVDVNDEGIVQVRLHGACVGCPSSTMTLAMGIERNLKDKIPEIKEVVCV